MQNPTLYNATIRPECLTAFNDQWETPTSDEIRAIIKHAGLTGSKAGNLVGVNSRTIRKWTGGERSIPYAAWALLCESAGFGMIWKVEQVTST